MNCTMKNNQLTVATSPKDGAKVPNASVNGINFTNVAGIAEINGTVYCLKANSNNQSTIVSTKNYQKTDTGKNGLCVIDYYCVGLTTDGINLYLIGSTKNAEGNTVGKLIKVSPNGNLLGTYDLNKTYAGIAYCGTNSFYLISSADANITLDIDKYNVPGGYQESFQLVNGGYAEMLQDIFYDAAHGLFVVTNQKDASGKYSPCKNIILLYDLKNRPTGKLRATSRFRLNYDTTKYKQFNTESMCIINGKLVTVANVALQAGGGTDAFSYVGDIDFGESGTFFMEHLVSVGKLIGNKELTPAELVSPDDTKYKPIFMAGCQSLSWANNRLIGLKRGCVQIPKPGSTTEYESDDNKAFVYLFEITGDYMSQSSTRNWVKLFKYQPKSTNLYHGNSLNYYDGHYYVGCAEPSGANQNTIVKLTVDGSIVKRYYSDFRTNAIAPYKDGKFILVSGTTSGKSYYDPVYKKSIILRPVFVGTLNDTTARFVVSDTYYFKDTSGTGITNGKHYMQDIYFNQKYGLFVAVSLLNEASKGIDFKNDLLHINIDKYEWVTVEDKTKIKMLTPDYSLVYKDRSIFYDCEYESPTIDESTGKMLLDVNAHKVSQSGGSGQSYDCVIRVDGITFS